MHAPNIPLHLSLTELHFIDSALQCGNFRSTIGGFSPVTRGIVTLPDQRTVFAKRAVDEQSATWIQKEAAVYRLLAELGYEHVPPLLGSTEKLLVLPDLSSADWSSRWTRAKVTAVWQALHELRAISIPEQHRSLFEPDTGKALPEEWRKLLDDELWRKVLNRAREFEPDTDDLRLLCSLTPAQRCELAERVTATEFLRNELVHLDIRSDNIAYDPVAGTVRLVDWNWAELSSSCLDETLFALSLLSAPIDGLATAEIVAKVDPAAALTAAGYWLRSCINDPLKPGDPDGLRPLQLSLGCRALRLSIEKPEAGQRP